MGAASQARPADAVSVAWYLLGTALASARDAVTFEVCKARVRSAIAFARDVATAENADERARNGLSAVPGFHVVGRAESSARSGGEAEHRSAPDEQASTLELMRRTCERVTATAKGWKAEAERLRAELETSNAGLLASERARALVVAERDRVEADAALEATHSNAFVMEVQSERDELRDECERLRNVVATVERDRDRWRQSSRVYEELSKKAIQQLAESRQAHDVTEMHATEAERALASESMRLASARATVECTLNVNTEQARRLDIARAALDTASEALASMARDGRSFPMAAREVNEALDVLREPFTKSEPPHECHRPWECNDRPNGVAPCTDTPTLDGEPTHDDNGTEVA